MHVLDLPRLVLEAVSKSVVYHEERPGERSATGVTPEGLKVRWRLTFSDVPTEPAEATLEIVDQGTDVDSFSYDVLLFPVWSVDRTTIVDFEQGFRQTSQYEGASHEQLALYVQLLSRIMESITRLVHEHGWQLRDGRQSAFGIPLEIPEHVFQYACSD